MDDSAAIRVRLAATLRRVAQPGSAILEAEDSKSAMAMFQKDKPDIVFLDMVLARGDGGLDTLRKMLDVRPEARIVLLTSLPPDHADMIAAIGLGAAAHVPKPITNEAIGRVLDQLEAEEGRLGRIR
ncbi:MAG TPA: response regulator [Candidatus Thermoplasmatota archaeon]|nr:response regulator [Candidatus Thermoplasmatota archaeon]